MNSFIFIAEVQLTLSKDNANLRYYQPAYKKKLQNAG